MTALILAIMLAASPAPAPEPEDPFVSSWSSNAGIVRAYTQGTETKSSALIAVASIYLDNGHDCYWTRLAAITMLREAIFAWDAENYSVFSALNSGIAALMAGEADGCVSAEVLG